MTTEKITYTTTADQIERMHDAFDAALADIEQDLGKSYPMMIGGKDRESADTFDVRSPIDRRIHVGSFPLASQTDVDDAVAAARNAFPEWSATPYTERAGIIKRAAALIRERKFRLSALLILEAGKNRAEAIGEVEEGADLLDEYADQMLENDGFSKSLESLDPAERNVSTLRPFGVFAVLAPFNFPHALSAGMTGGALVAGNTVVFKPASATPVSGYELTRCYLDAGVLPGAFNFVTGSGEVVGESLTNHRGVDGVAFTGSKEVGLALYHDFSPSYARPCITEMGGKNPTIVTSKADIGKAVEGVVRSAFGYSGQKCSACSRVYVEQAVYDQFMQGLLDRTATIEVGDPRDRSVFVGPVIDDRAVQRFEKSVGSVPAGSVRIGGDRMWGELFDDGTYVAPTIVDGISADHEVFKQELFLPFLAVAGVESLDEAINHSNNTEYGLTAGIFSEDQQEIDHFFDTIEAGVVYANRSGGATTGAWPGCQSFCGWKASGSTGKGGLGPYYVQQFMREQSRTVVS